jgi:selenocysteine lyase/cysteine desulfurase
MSGSAALWPRLAAARDGRHASLPATPAAPDEKFWAAVRGQFALSPEVAALNAANLCPSPSPVIEAMYGAGDLDHDLSPANRDRMYRAKETARKQVAAFLRVTPEEVLLTRNTSESNNLVSSGLDLKPGDEVLIFSDNHPSNNAAWKEKARRWGFRVSEVRVVSPHPGAEHYLKAAAAAITTRTRIMAFTHVTNTVGDLFPARELCRMARERDVLSVVDGAQSFGVIDVDLGDMQPDFYTGSSHKWLCGPKELGLLYVREDVQPRLWPSVVSLYAGATGISKTHEGFGQRDEPALAAFGAAVEFQTRIGRATIEQRARELARALREGLQGIEGIEIWTHPDASRSHSVMTFRPGNLDPTKLAAALYQSDHIVCAARSGADRSGLRLSPHLYNLHSEVDRTLAALRRYLARGL